MKGGTPLQRQDAQQQIRLWLQLAYDAYRRRQVIRALHYFHRSLDYARENERVQEIAVVCRDLGYVYVREGSLDHALTYCEQGLATSGVDLPIRTGLMANKASVLARQGRYHAAFTLLQEGCGLIRSSYPDFSHAPSDLVHSHAAMTQMAEDVRRVVGFLDMGIRAERIQVEIRGHQPPWLANEQ